MTALISKLKNSEAVKFINWRIAFNGNSKISKGAYNNYLQQSIYLCHKRYIIITCNNPYIFVTTARSNQGHTMMLHTYTPNQCPYQVSTFYTLGFLRYSPYKIFKLKVMTSRIKPRSHHDVAHLLTNVPT